MTTREECHVEIQATLVLEGPQEGHGWRRWVVHLAPTGQHLGAILQRDGETGYQVLLSQVGRSRYRQDADQLEREQALERLVHLRLHGGQG